MVHRALKTVEAMYRSAMADSATIPAAELRAKAMEVFAAVRQREENEDKIWWACAGELTRAWVVECDVQEPLVNNVEYVSIGSRRSMEELQEVDNSGAIVSVAIRLGKVRLIDNHFI